MDYDDDGRESLRLGRRENNEDHLGARLERWWGDCAAWCSSRWAWRSSLCMMVTALACERFPAKAAVRLTWGKPVALAYLFHVPTPLSRSSTEIAERDVAWDEGSLVSTAWRQVIRGDVLRRAIVDVDRLVDGGGEAHSG